MYGKDEVKVFKTRGKGFIFGLCIFFLAFIIAVVIEFTVLINTLDESLSSTRLIRLAIYFAVALVLGFLGSRMIKEHTIEISPDGITITRGKKTEKYPLDAIVGTKVTRNYVNGIYTGSERKLKLLKDGKVKDYSCSNYGKRQFSEIVATVDDLKFKNKARKDDFGRNRQELEVDLSEAPKSNKFIDNEREYLIPRDEILKLNKKKIRKNLLMPTILALIIIGMGVYLWITTKDGVTPFAVTVPMALFVYLIYLVTPVYRYRKCVKYLPSNIVINRDGIKVDDQLFEKDSIKKIMVMPASYNNDDFRYIAVYDKKGRHYYAFGTAPDRLGKNDYSYSDYEDLQGFLKYWCLYNDVTYILDLR